MSTIILDSAVVLPAGVVLTPVESFALDMVIQSKCQNPSTNLVTPITGQLLLSNDGGQTYVLADTKRFTIGAGDIAYQAFHLYDYATQIINSQVSFVGPSAGPRTEPGSFPPAQPNWTNFMVRFTGNSGGSVVISCILDGGGTGGGGSSSGGTVTNVSVATAQGFTGSVTTAATTPLITMGTTASGMLKGVSGSLVAAVQNTDYQGPLTLTTAGTSGPATFVGNTLNVPNYATGGSGSGTVNTGTSNQLAFYAGAGTAVSGLGVGTGLKIVSGSLVDLTDVVVNLTQSSPTIAVDASQGGYQTVTLNQNATFTVSNAPIGDSFALAITQPSGGSFTVTWFAGITAWIGTATPPTTIPSGAVLEVVFKTVAANTYYGHVIGISGVSSSGAAAGAANSIQWNNAGALAGFTATGDATINPATGAVAVLSTGTHTFVQSAWIDTTNAGNISTGTLLAGRFPAFSGVVSTASGSTTTTFSGTGALPATQLPALSGVVQSAAGSGVTSFSGSGALPAGQMPALTGVVLATAGTGVTTFAAIPALSLFGNTTGGSAVPTTPTMTAFLDALLGSAQGTIAYRGASNWSGLAPGAICQPLQSGGAGGNPAFSSAFLLPSVGGSPGYTVRNIFALSGGTSAVQNTTSGSLLTGATGQGGQTLSIAANTLRAGSMLRFSFFGTMGLTASSITVTYSFSLNAVTVMATGTISVSAASSNMCFQTLIPISINFWGSGSSGLLGGFGQISVSGGSGGVAPATIGIYNTGGATRNGSGIAFNYTIANAIDFGITFSTADPANTAKITGAAIEVIGAL